MCQPASGSFANPEGSWAHGHLVGCGPQTHIYEAPGDRGISSIAVLGSKEAGGGGRATCPELRPLGGHPQCHVGPVLGVTATGPWSQGRCLRANCLSYRTRAPQDSGPATLISVSSSWPPAWSRGAGSSWGSGDLQRDKHGSPVKPLNTGILGERGPSSWARPLCRAHFSLAACPRVSRVLTVGQEVSSRA